MTVLQEILEWSKGRPIWQRDALRRLVLNRELSDADIHALAEICKSAHGLAEQQPATPLTEDHVPGKSAGAAPVSLASIVHHRGVNALAEDQTLRFASGLTVVYGDNAAGKSGYIRILKSACRARGQETILGNVVSGTAPPTPIVTIEYQVGSEAESREWTGNGDDEYISRVSVFDAHCAAVYLTEKTDVAFRPFGLDLFDQLVKACKAVRVELEREQSSLVSNALATVQARIPEGTTVASLLANINSLTKPETVRALARLSPDEETRLAQLEKSLLDLQANDSTNLTRQLNLQLARVRALAQHLHEVEAALSEQAIATAFDARTEGRRKSEEARRLREATFPVGLLDGTGSEIWATLWEAARQFSEQHAYPGQAFPVVGPTSQCVLCQQDLNRTAGERLRQFEAFVVSTTERELRQIREKFARLRRAFADLKTTTEAAEQTIKEIRIEHEVTAKAIEAAIATNESRRQAVVLALTKDEELGDCPALVSVAHRADALSREIDARITTLRTRTTDETRKQITTEAQELRARKLLAEHKQIVLDEIERKKKYAAYGLCIDDTKTQAITLKSSAVTRTAVTQTLTQSFKDELVKLKFHQIEVEITEVGGEEGVLYHKLALTRAPGVELPRVVSEGEQRCLAIAAFFAELSTADDPSGIVFDDPVSSLDYKWRESLAQRLVEEAKSRQVIVFTHDVVFLHLLRQFAKELGVEQLDQHVRNLSIGAGVCIEELPWVALSITKRIGYLKNEWQAADKLFRDGQQDDYERRATYVYGLLREAWERAVEEVLLDRIVERFRPSVQTQHISVIADITDQDCQTVGTAMTKCSRWLPGHDEAAAARAPVPEPPELRADIEELETWVRAIRNRRG